MPGKKILLVTDNRFWRGSLGSHSRILALYEYYIKKEFNVLVLFVGYLYEPDTVILDAKFSDMELVNFENGSSYIPLWHRLYYVITQRAVKLLPNRVKHLIKSWVSGSQSLTVNAVNSQVDVPSKFDEPTLSDFVRDDYQLLFKHVVNQYWPDVIQVEYVRLAYLVDQLSEIQKEKIVKVIDTHDVMYLRKRGFNEMGRAHDINISPQQEGAQLSKFDFVLAIQNKDKFEFEKLVPGLTVLLVMHPFKMNKKEARIGDVINVTYIGSSMEPNVDGIEGFIKNAWPAVQDQCGSQAKLNIYGNICEALGKFGDEVNIKLHGFVDQIDDVYREADIAINPVMYGGGLKIKTVEALCYSLPLVTTPAGALGIEDKSGKAFIVCDHHKDMASKLISLIESSEKRTEYSNRSYTFAYEHFREEVVFRDLIQVLSN